MEFLTTRYATQVAFLSITSLNYCLLSIKVTIDSIDYRAVREVIGTSAINGLANILSRASDAPKKRLVFSLFALNRQL